MLKDRVQRKWTDDEVNRALQMRNDGYDSGEIGRAIGRAAGSVRDLFRRLRNPMCRSRREQARLMLQTMTAPEVAQQMGVSEAWLRKWVLEARTPRAAGVFIQRQQIPDWLIEERDRRYAEPRTITMELMGDPEPSRSALSNASLRQHQS